MAAGIESPPIYPKGRYQEATNFWLHNSTYITKTDSTYPYWTKLKSIAKADGHDPLLVWQAIKLQRNLSTLEIELGDSFSLNLPHFIQRMLHELDMHCGGSLQSLVESPISEKQKKTFIISSLRTEAFHSSVLEGAVATKERAKEIIKSNKAPKTEGEKMIYNNYKAMEYILEHKGEKLTMAALFDLHEILVNGTLEATKVGRFRNETESIDVVDVLLGESIYTPPNAKEVKDRMEKLLYFFNESETKGLSRKEDQPFIHPIIRAIIVHFMIGHIHPFYDGNGRIARALFYWHMLANGYWLAEYLSISQIILKSKSQYYRAFQQVEKDENDLTYFMQYNLKALGQAFDQLIEYLDRKLKTQTNAVVDLAGQYGITTRQAEILAIINKSQTVWTAQQIQTKLHVSANTARTALNELTEIGLLERLALDKKTQGWRLV